MLSNILDSTVEFQFYSYSKVKNYNYVIPFLFMVYTERKILLSNICDRGRIISERVLFHQEQIINVV